jgi:hypothetical protein
VTQRLPTAQHSTHTPPTTPPTRARSKAALLVAGDTAALLLFAAVGRANHAGDGMGMETVATALPFLVGEWVWVWVCVCGSGFLLMVFFYYVSRAI